MVYGLYANTEDTFTSLALGYVHTLVKTTPLIIFKINKAEKKPQVVILSCFGAVLPKKVYSEIILT